MIIRRVLTFNRVVLALNMFGLDTLLRCRIARFMQVLLMVFGMLWVAMVWVRALMVGRDTARDRRRLVRLFSLCLLSRCIS